MCTDRARLFRHVRFSVRFLPGEQQVIEIVSAKCQNEARRLCGQTMLQGCQLVSTKHTHASLGGERHTYICLIIICLCVMCYMFYCLICGALVIIGRKAMLNISELSILGSQRASVSRFVVIDIVIGIIGSFGATISKNNNTAETSLDSAGESGAISWLCIAL